MIKTRWDIFSRWFEKREFPKRHVQRKKELSLRCAAVIQRHCNCHNKSVVNVSTKLEQWGLLSSRVDLPQFMTQLFARILWFFNFPNEISWSRNVFPSALGPSYWNLSFPSCSCGLLNGKWLPPFEGGLSGQIDGGSSSPIVILLL